MTTANHFSLQKPSKHIEEVGCDISGMALGVSSRLAILTDAAKELEQLVQTSAAGRLISSSTSTEFQLIFLFFLSEPKCTRLTGRHQIAPRKAENKTHQRWFLTKKTSYSFFNLPEEIKTTFYKTLVEGIIRPRFNELFPSCCHRNKEEWFSRLDSGRVGYLWRRGFDSGRIGQAHFGNAWSRDTPLG